MSSERHGQTSKASSLVLIVIAYACAIGAAAAYLYLGRGSLYTSGNLLIDTLIADVVGTVVIFGFSRVFGNSSFYDAYWSVIPPLILLYWHQQSPAGTDATRYLMLSVVVWYWAIRLTWNWTKYWEGLKHEDWRYIMLKQKFPGVTFVIDFSAIHFIPTLQVFAGMLPVYACFFFEERGVHLIDYIALAAGVAAASIQLLADRQLRAFIDQHTSGTVLNTGLWAWSRHPNYFGEILFWFSLALFGYAAAPAQWAWVFVGAIAMLMLFLFGSIPMMEKRSLERRPNYQQVIDRTSMLIPLPPRSADAVSGD